MNGFKKNNRRSKLEDTFEIILNEYNINYNYELTKLTYIIPESKHTYLIDWTLPNNLYIETKGYLSNAQERNKYKLIKQQYPNIDLRFVFDNPNKLCGGTKYTHAVWAEKNKFKYCGIKDIETILEWVSHDNKNECIT